MSYKEYFLELVAKNRANCDNLTDKEYNNKVINVIENFKFDEIKISQMPKESWICLTLFAYLGEDNAGGWFQ